MVEGCTRHFTEVEQTIARARKQLAQANLLIRMYTPTASRFLRPGDNNNNNNSEPNAEPALLSRSRPLHFLACLFDKTYRMYFH
jgi:hypothetical protein